MPALSGMDHELPSGEADRANHSDASASGEGAKAISSAQRPSLLRAVVAWLLLHLRLWVSLLFLGAIAAGVALTTPHLRAWYHLRAARSELQRWHNAQAIRHLQVCLRTWPRDPDVLLLAAQSARRGRSYGEAEHFLEMYQQARGLDEAYSLEQLLLSAERRLDPVADLCFHYVEEGHPQTPLILEALTRSYLYHYRLGEARLCLDRWLNLLPDHPQALCLEGLYYLDFGHARSSAEKSYRRVLELDPEHEEARLGLSVALLDDHNYEEAAQHLAYLRQRQPENLSVQIGLAECLDGLGEQEEAVRIVDVVLDQKADFAPGLSLRGRLAIKGKQFVEAENWLREAVRLNPNDYRARYSLVQCLSHNGKEQEAQQQQNDLEVLEKDLTRFNSIVTREIVQRPRDPALHCTLGQLLLRSGQREEGLRYLQNALRLDPTYAPARQALEDYKAKAQARQGDGKQEPR